MSDQNLTMILGSILALIIACVLLFGCYKLIMWIIGQIGPALLKTMVFAGLIIIALMYFKPELFDKFIPQQQTAPTQYIWTSQSKKI